MNTQIKFEVRTAITNSKADESQKKVLETHIDTLSSGKVAQLITIFEKEPRAVVAYADYIKALKKESLPISEETLEKILTSLLSKLS